MPLPENIIILFYWTAPFGRSFFLPGAGAESEEKQAAEKVQISAALCLQFVYIHPLTTIGGGVKLVLALRDTEC